MGGSSAVAGIEDEFVVNRAAAMASGRMVHFREYIRRQDASIAPVINAGRGDAKGNMLDTLRSYGHGLDGGCLLKVIRHMALEYITLGRGNS